MQATRPHSSIPALELAIKQKKEPGDILLAYYKLPHITSSSVVTCDSMFDDSQEAEEIVEMFPSPAGILCDYQWNREHEAIWANVTDVFSEDKPLFYLHVSHLPTPNPDPAGVTVSLAGGGEWPQENKYLVDIQNDGKLFRVYVYTNFLHDDEYIVSYTAEITDRRGRKRVIPNYTEALYPQPVGMLSASEVPGLAGLTYTVSRAGTPSSIRIAVNDSIIHDTRHPVAFRYSIVAEATKSNGEKIVYQTPWQAETVLNPACLTYIDESIYNNGRKILDNRKVNDIMAPLIGKEVLSDPDTVIRYSVLSNNKYVQVSCRPDGESVPYAYTEVNTGQPPAIVQQKGRKWRYIEYTKESLANLGFKDIKRDVRVVATVTINDRPVKWRIYDIEGSYGFDSREITIRPEDFPGIPEDAVLEIELANRPVGIDIQLYVGGQECFGPNGELAVKWSRVKQEGQVVAKIREVYRPGCFVHLYGVKLTKNVSLQIDVPEQELSTPWYVRVKRGRMVRIVDGNTALLYELAEEPIVKTVNNISVGVFDGGLIKFRHSPLITGMTVNGQPAGLAVFIDDKPTEVEWYDLTSGLAKINTQAGSKSAVTASYTYRVDWAEYHGYTDTGEYRELNLNPAERTCCIGREFHIYARPSAKLSNTGYTYQERLIPFKTGRKRKQILWYVRLENTPAKDRKTKVYRRSNNEEVPYGHGRVYWTWSETEQNVIIIHNPDIIPDPAGKMPEYYYADYYYYDKEWHIEEAYNWQDYIFHSEEEIDNEDWLYLGRVGVFPDCKPEDAVLYDARSRGGGIREDLLPQAALIEPESRHYFDIGYWDGEPWQASGAAKVFLPERLKSKPYWSEELVKQKVNKHKVSGNLALVDYWDAEERYPDRPARLVIDTVEISEETGFAPPKHLILGTITS